MSNPQGYPQARCEGSAAHDAHDWPTPTRNYAAPPLWHCPGVAEQGERIEPLSVSFEGPDGVAYEADAVPDGTPGGMVVRWDAQGVMRVELPDA